MSRLSLLQQKNHEIMNDIDTIDTDTLDIDTQLLKLELKETIE